MSDSERFLNQSAAAKHFGVSKQLITRKKQQGKLTMRGDLVDVLNSTGAFGGNGKPVGVVNTPVDEAGSQPEDADASGESFAQAQCRKEIALANTRELEFRLKSGDLVLVADMERAWSEAAQTFRDGLISFPETVAPALAALTDPRQIRDTIKAEIRKVLVSLPERIMNVATDQQAA